MYVCMIPDRVLLSLCYLVTFFSFWFSVEGERGLVVPPFLGLGLGVCTYIAYI